MSSNAYSAELKTDPLLRQLVLWSGIACAGTGAVLTLTLPLPMLLRAVSACAWCVLSARELLQLRAAWASCLALRFTAEGEIAVLGRDHEWRPARLVSGGILLRRLGWIRLRGPTGTVFSEPLRGCCRASRNWRRLHVIWRHVGA